MNALGNFQGYLLGPGGESRVKGLASALGKVLKPVAGYRLRSGSKGNA